VIGNIVKSFIILSFSLLINLGSMAHGETSVEKEYAVKAAFIYNIAKFVEWPKESMNKSETLNVCVWGDNPFGSSLKALEGKDVQGKKFVIKNAKTVEDINHCQIVFVGKSEQKNLSKILTILNGRSVLTVGDTEDFAHRGGIVNFYLENEMIRFEINLDAVKRAGLNISSKLLKLARIVTVKNP
jgi:hypothetical protein